MSVRHLVIVGDRSGVGLIEGAAISERGANHVSVYDVVPHQEIDLNDLIFSRHPPETTEIFAAVGAVGLNFARHNIWARMRIAGYRGATIVHSQAVVDKSAKLSENVYIGAGAIVEGRATIGQGSIVSTAAIVGSDASIGQWSWIDRAVVVGAAATVGMHCILGAGVRLADNTRFPGPGILEVPGLYRGEYSPGVFITPEFPGAGARLLIV